MENDKGNKQKDKAEKLLEDYNDVFADIVNGSLFGGRQVVKKDDLQDVGILSQFKSDDGFLHETERDVAKLWKHEGQQFAIALYGIENQTKPEKYMPFRIFGYEGNSYNS